MSVTGLPKWRGVGSAIRSLGDRVLGRGKRMARHTACRTLRVDPLEERALLALAPNDLVDTVINQNVIPGNLIEVGIPLSTNVNGTLSGQSVASDNDGDFVVAWVRSDPVLDPFSGLPIIDPQTGQEIVDSNIYARYFTDEVQRITLPTAIAQDNVIGVNGRFTLVYGTEVQRLTLSATYRPNTLFQPNIVGQFQLWFDEDGNGVVNPGETAVIFYNEQSIANGAVTLADVAANMQTALQGIGGPLQDVSVVPINPHEFVIAFGPAAGNVNQPEIRVLSSTFTSGFLPAVQVDTLRNPIVLSNIPVSATNALDTVRAIEQAFLRATIANHPIAPVDFPPDNRLPSLVEGPVTRPLTLRRAVPQVSVVAVNTTQFDVTFTGVSGKKDHPLMVVTQAFDDFGNNLLPSPQLQVRTLKEPSPEFRVNPEEPDDPFTPGPDVFYQRNSSVAMDADGDFVIVWESDVSNSLVFSSFSDIFGRRFKPIGNVPPAQIDFVQGVSLLAIPPSESASGIDAFTFRVNDTVTNPQFQPAVAMDEAGNFVVAWANGAQDISFFNGIRAQRFNRHGERLGPEFLVNTEETAIQLEPAVAMSLTGQFVIAWERTTDPSFLVGGPYATSIQVRGYDNLGQPLVPEFSPFGGGPATIAFDSTNNFLVGTTIGNVDNDGGATSTGTRAILYQLPATVGAATIRRDLFRPNSASLTPASQTLWPNAQFGQHVSMDADGDIVIMYEGYGPDTSETTLIPGSLFASLINLNQNLDLLPFFDPSVENLANGRLPNPTNGGAFDGWFTFQSFFSAVNSNGDVDGVIENVLTNAQNAGATDGQLGRLRALLDRVATLLRGEANGILFSRWDADPNFVLNTLFSDSIANATRDGHNQRTYLILDRNIDWDRFEVVVDGQTINVPAGRTPTTPSAFDPIQTRVNIDTAIETAVSVGDEWRENPTTDYEGPINVRILTSAEVTARQGTYWELNGVDPNDYVYEVTFQGSAHDRFASLFAIRGFSTGRETQVMSFTPLGGLPLQGLFHLEWFDANGNLQTSGPIAFNSNAPGAVAAAIQGALLGAANNPFAGVQVTAIPGGPPFQFQILFAQNTDQPTILAFPNIDPQTGLPLLPATIGTQVINNGGSAQVAPPDTLTFQFGDSGIRQTEGSVGIEPDGSFVTAWTQVEEFTDGTASNATIRYRRFEEQFDTAGPRLTDVVAPDGRQIDNAATISTTNGLTHVVLTFDEEMLLFDEATLQFALQQRDIFLNNNQAVPATIKRILDSANNPENYQILLIGQPIGGGIARVEFGMNKAADLATAYGLNPIPTNKWEAVITLDSDSSTAGFQPLPDGTYTIVAVAPVPASPTQAERSGLRDKAGNPLGHTGFLIGGRNFTRTFRVLVGQPGPEPPGPPSPGSVDAIVNTTLLGDQTQPAAAANNNSDYVVVWVSPGQGTDTGTQTNIIGQRFNRIGVPQGPEFIVNTYQTNNQLAPDIAMDDRGNFVVVWQGEGDLDSTGIFARVYDRFGAPRGNQFRVNDYALNTQFARAWRWTATAISWSPGAAPAPATATGSTPGASTASARPWAPSSR